MTMKKLKYKSMDELQNDADVSDMYKRIKLDEFLKISGRFLNSVNEFKKEGDDEMLYVYCFRFVSLAIYMRDNVPKFRDDHKYYKSMFENDVRNMLEIMEVKKDILLKKYENLAKNNNGDDGIENAKENAGDIPNGCEREISSIDVYKFEDPAERKLSLSCLELFNILEKKIPYSILVFDVRTREEFDDSHMTFAEVLIHVPKSPFWEKCVAAKKLREHIDREYLERFENRGKYEQIVLMDWDCEATKYNQGYPLYWIKNTFEKWDPSVQYKRSILILDGGYKKWQRCYPAFTTNSLPPPPRKSDVPADDKPKKLAPILQSIEYPSLVDGEEEECKKPIHIVVAPTKQPPYKIPRVDRSNKPIDSRSAYRYTSGMMDWGKLGKVEAGTEKGKSLQSLYGKLSDLTRPRSDTKAVAAEKADVKKRFTSPAPEVDSISKINNNIINEKEKEEHLFDNTHIEPEPIVTEEAPNVQPQIDRSNKPSYENDTRFINHAFDKPIFPMATRTKFVGLNNLGNTCYMNSILQCLCNTKYLADYFCEAPHLTINRGSRTKGDIALEYQKVCRRIKGSDGGSILCNDLKTLVGKYKQSFAGSGQQDAHEFLTIFIDWLHEDLNRPNNEEEGFSLEGADERSGEKAWGEFARKNASIVRELFYGQQKSTVICEGCGKPSVMFEPFSHLSLPIPERCQETTLSDCVRLYLKEEGISGWQCSKCSSTSEAVKKLDISLLPPILVIHFKRFTNDGNMRKSETAIEFPVESVLDMRDFVEGWEHRNLKYKLYAVSNHSGTMEYGHYTALCRHPESNRWFMLDDESVSISRTISTTSSCGKAYILFFKKVEDAY